MGREDPKQGICRDYKVMAGGSVLHSMKGSFCHPPLNSNCLQRDWVEGLF